MHGIPVITTDVGDSKAFALDHRWLVETGSESSLTAALNAFAALSPEERRMLASSSRERAVMEFDLAQVAYKYTSAYRRFSRPDMEKLGTPS